MKTLYKYVKPYGYIIGVEFLVKFIATILDLLLPWLLSYIIDDVAPNNDREGVFFYGGLMAASAVLAIIMNIGANRMAIKTARDISLKYRHDLFAKVSYLSAAKTDEFTLPSLISRLTSDTYNVHDMVDRMQRLGIRAPILLLGGIFVTLTLEPALTLIMIMILPLLAFIIFYVSKKGVRLYTATQTSIDKMVRKVQENMTGVRIIKALSKSNYEKDKFNDINDEVVAKDTKAGVLMALTNPAMNLLLNIGLTLVVVVGAFRVNSGISQPGKIIAFLSYFAIIMNALMLITRVFVVYSKGSASAERIESVMLSEEGMPVMYGGADAESPYHIEFRNVTFSYNKVRNNLTDVSFTLKKGETLGIIGSTGSGKSTVFNLLMRFYDPDSGSIFIDGRDIKSIPLKELRGKFGVAFQNDFLYAGTIKENIDFGRELPEEDLKIAVDTAQVGFIAEKENGYEYKLTVKGANMSGGQKQRLLIARALAGKPEILILDDSSSALDYLTDAALRKSLGKHFGDTTSLIVAQRVSSIMHSEKIIVISDGALTGMGTHKQLLATCPVYKEIYNIQMGGAL